MAITTSARSLAKKLNITPQAVHDAAEKLGLGQKGEYRNSPLYLDEIAGLKISEHVFEDRIADAQASITALTVERLEIWREMGRLASLARAMSHPAAAELEELNNLVKGTPTPPKASALRADVGQFKNQVADCLVAYRRIESRASALSKAIHNKLS